MMEVQQVIMFKVGITVTDVFNISVNEIVFGLR